MLKSKLLIAFSFFLFFLNPSTFAQVTTTYGTGMTPMQLVQNFLLGSGVTISNVSFNNSSTPITSSNQIGSFSTGVSPSNLGFGNGLTIATGGIEVATSGALTSVVNGPQISSDPELQALKPGKTLHDVARLEFDFIPSSDTVKFRYVFASNEYLTAVCTSYDDVFGFFISGADPAGGNYINKNIALVPGTNLPVSINTINGGVSMGSSTPCFLNYTQYYHSFTPNITYRGGTVPLTAWAKVVPCTTYHIKIAICDVSNSIYDSGVFLEANSFSSSQVLVSHSFTHPSVSDTVMIRGCNDAIIHLKLPNSVNYNYPIPIIKQGTAVNGTDYPLIPDTVYIPANSDSISFTISPYNNSSFTSIRTIKLIIKVSTCMFDTLVIDILPNLPLVANAFGDTIVCKNTSVPISVNNMGGLAPYYSSWSDGDTNTTRVVVANDIHLFQVTTTDACGQIAKDSVLVDVFPGYSLTVSANPNPICLGQNVQLNANGATSYLWSSDVSDPSLLPQTTLNNPLVTPTITTLYRVTAADIHDCKITDSILVQIFPPLNAIIIANPNPVSIFDPTVHFSSSSVGGTSWLWDTGDGYTTTDQDFIHTYAGANAQNYTVSLTVANASGCSETKNLQIVVYPDLKLYLPNAFTPDFQTNKIFKAYGEGVLDFEMRIFNRFGECVFSSFDLGMGWDGKYQNKFSQEGTYVYTVKYKDFLGNSYTKNGCVFLIW